MTETQIQNFILDYLNALGGYVCKIELSGKPVKTPQGFKLIPFKNKYYRKSMSDILFFYKSNFYAFEVKTPQEHEKVKKNLNRFRTKTINQIPKYLHHYKKQFDFIECVKKQGGHGGFVSSLSDVKNIMCHKN